MVLKQKGKPDRNKKPLRGGPREFSDPREFPDGPLETEDHGSSSSDAETSSGEETNVVETVGRGAPAARPAAQGQATRPATATASAPREPSRREREEIQKEQARQHYLKMKEKEDGARLAAIRKQREEDAARHAEAQRGTLRRDEKIGDLFYIVAKEMAKRRI